jgi:surface polysaccharide O-acyltransferase-like enzyme
VLAIAGVVIIHVVGNLVENDGWRGTLRWWAAWTLLVFVVVGVATMAGLSRPIWLGSLTRWWPYVGYFLAGWALHRLVLRGRWVAVTALVTVVVLAEMIWQYGTAPAHPNLQALLPVSYLGLTTAVASICVFLIAVGLGAPGTARGHGWPVRWSGCPTRPSGCSRSTC